MAKKEKKFVLLKDIVIPKGTVLTRAPAVTKRDQHHFGCTVGLSRNTCGDFTYSLDPECDVVEVSDYFTELKE